MTGPGGGTATAAPGDSPARLTGRMLLIGFGLVIGLVLLLAAIGAIVGEAPDPPPDCAVGTVCGGPPPVTGSEAGSIASFPPASAALPAGTVGIRAGTPWTSTDLGYEFEYYPGLWTPDDASGVGVDFVAADGAGEDVFLNVVGVPASEMSVQEYADYWRRIILEWAPDIKLDTSGRNAILGPAIGYVDGIASTFAGSVSTPQGGTDPVGVSVVVASDGRTTVAVIVTVYDPDRKNANDGWWQHDVRRRVDLILKTFRWETGT